MGAIAGILPRGSSLDRETLTATLAACSEAMRRRAPIEGGMGVAYDGSVGLAHRASEGPGGEAVLQPLRNENGSLWLVADGEPSNAQDLRLELIGDGHQFQSACGSEVILHLYEQQGVGAFERLAGSFAFALWDREQRVLILGRDRFGEKPLYVLDGPDRFAFASEVRALVPETTLAPAAAVAFLTLGYLPEPLTVAPGVRALAPGSFLRVRMSRARTESFWDHLSAQPTGEIGTDRLTLGRLVRESVQTAVAGEEDIGVVLDGGTSRAALLALVSPTLGRGLRTHAMVFEAEGRGRGAERADCAVAARSRAVADWFRAEHHEHRIGAKDFGAAFERTSTASQPSLGGPLALVEAAYVAMSGDRVLLSGLGGSELLAIGAGRWSPWIWRAGRRTSTRALARATARFAARLRPFSNAGRLADTLVTEDAVAAAHLSVRGLLGLTALQRLLRPEVLEEARAGFDALAYVRSLAARVPDAAFLPSNRSAKEAAVHVAAGVERGGRLVSGRLRDMESASTALGLALRVPYLDHRLCDWLDAAPSPGSGSRLLAEVLDGMLPPPLRRPMRPTPPPIGSWLRGPLRPLAEGCVLADDPDGLFVRDGVETLWRGFLAGKIGWRAVWPVAVLRAWMSAQRDRARVAPRRTLRSQHAA